MNAIFNNREIAIGIWLVIFIVFVGANRSLRFSSYDIFKPLFNRYIVFPFVLLVGYIFLIVIILYRLGAWDIGQLKNTILWSLSYALTSMFRISKIESEEHYFRNSIKDQLKIVAAFEFIVTFYTYSLLSELIIVPLVAFVVGMQALTEGKKEYALVGKLLTGVLTLFSIGLIANATYNLITDFDGFAKLGTLKDFGIPIVLSILLIPFIFALFIYTSYENAFIRIKQCIQDTALISCAKRKAIFEFNFHINLLKRWLRNIAINPPTDKLELQTSIRHVKTLASRQKNPAIVALSDGWSPYLACKFLSSKNLITNDYHQDAFDASSWFASSNYLEVGAGIFPNNIAYYIEGDELIARKLKLVVNFNDVESEKETTVKFIEIASELIRNSLAQDMPEILVEKLISKTPTDIDVFGKDISIEIENWPTKLGYSIKLIFKISQV